MGFGWDKVPFLSWSAQSGGLDLQTEATRSTSSADRTEIGVRGESSVVSTYRPSESNVLKPSGNIYAGSLGIKAVFH